MFRGPSRWAQSPGVRTKVYPNGFLQAINVLKVKPSFFQAPPCSDLPSLSPWGGSIRREFGCKNDSPPDVDLHLCLPKDIAPDPHLVRLLSRLQRRPWIFTAATAETGRPERPRRRRRSFYINAMSLLKSTFIEETPGSFFSSFLHSGRGGVVPCLVSPKGRSHESLRVPKACAALLGGSEK